MYICLLTTVFASWLTLLLYVYSVVYPIHPLATHTVPLKDPGVVYLGEVRKGFLCVQSIKIQHSQTSYSALVISQLQIFTLLRLDQL